MKPACKLWKDCPYYDKNAVTCNEDGGEGYCGKYRKLRNKQNENIQNNI